MRKKPILDTIRRRRGLTLVEIVVVIALLGLLMTILGGSLLGTLESSKVDATRITISQIEGALEIYNVKKGKYPKALDDASKFMRDSQVPKDAWGNDFDYSTNSSCGKSYEIISMGKDGKKGGDEEAGDISSCGGDE
jgi:general secretion pathway protein G